MSAGVDTIGVNPGDAIDRIGTLKNPEKGVQKLVSEMVDSRIKYLEEKVTPNMVDLTRRQQFIREMNSIVSKIQSVTGDDGKATLTEEDFKLLEKFGAETYELSPEQLLVKGVGEVYSAEEVKKLIQSIKLYVEPDKSAKIIRIIERLAAESADGTLEVGVHKIRTAVRGYEEGSIDLKKLLDFCKKRKNEDRIDIETLRRYMPADGSGAKTKELTKDQRDQLLDIFSRHLKDVETKNDMQYQKVQRLYQEKYQTYEIAKTLLKSIEDAIKRLAAAIQGR